jgi:hypothetical protein
MWTTVSTEDLVPSDHPLRSLRVIVNDALNALSPRFSKIYSKVGRPSIAPEKLLRAMLLQVFYSIRSERMLVEQLRYNMLFRWFVGLSIDDPVWDATTFTKNRQRFLDGEIPLNKAYMTAMLITPPTIGLPFFLGYLDCAGGGAWRGIIGAIGPAKLCPHLLQNAASAWLSAPHRGQNFISVLPT